MWLVVAAEWASGQYRLLGSLKEVALRNADCAGASISYSETLTLLQSNIAVVSCPTATGQESEHVHCSMHSLSQFSV